MGYRSDFQLILNCSCAEKADEVIDKLNNYAQQFGSAPTLMGEMIAKALMEHTPDEVIHFEDSSWKLHDWDILMSDLDTMFGEDEEVDIGWVKLGEDHDDIEMMSGHYTYPCISREICHPDLNDVPKKLPQAAAPAPVQVSCQCDMHQLMRGEGHDVGCPET